MQEIYKFLQEVKTFFVVTAEGDQPRVRPIGAVCVYEGKLYISTSNKKPIWQQIQKNPKIGICAAKEAEGKWLIITTTLVHDQRREARVQLFKENPELASIHNVDDGMLQVMYMKDAKATFSSFSGESKDIKF
jgi:uncharacterized pyridoxamine 5'-phosphate oxidase family protein